MPENFLYLVGGDPHGLLTRNAKGQAHPDSPKVPVGGIVVPGRTQPVSGR